MILWGPPGRRQDDARAADGGRLQRRIHRALRGAVGRQGHPRRGRARARPTLAQSGRHTILFVDEVHRFNKAQQDAFLPFVEQGLVTFIGATTENPSFEVNGALLSRAAVYVLEPLVAPTSSGSCSTARWPPALPGVAIDDRRARRARSRYADGDGRRLHQHGRAAGDRRRRAGARRRSTSRSSRRRSRAACAASTRAARRSTTRSRRCTSRCAVRTRTRRSTGCAGCSTAAPIRSTSGGA